MVVLLAKHHANAELAVLSKVRLEIHVVVAGWEGDSQVLSVVVCHTSYMCTATCNYERSRIFGFPL